MNFLQSTATTGQKRLLVDKLSISSSSGYYTGLEQKDNLTRGHEAYNVSGGFHLNETKAVPVQEREYYRTVQIKSLTKKHLSEPIDVIIEFDENSYIAKTVDLPLYALGEDVYEAVQNLKCEIETLYNELQEDDDFSEEWLNYKEFLSKIIL